MSAVFGRRLTSSAGTARRSVERAVDPCGEGDAHLDAGQLPAQALVDAVAEGQVAAVLPEQVEPVGGGEAFGVAVGGAEGQDDRRAGLDGLAVQLDVLQCDPERGESARGLSTTSARPGG
jgi:hypothetical protein